MPRRAREKSNSGIYHLMLRENNKQNLFGEDGERLNFIETMQNAGGTRDKRGTGSLVPSKAILILVLEGQ